MANAPRGQVTAKDDGKGNLTIQIPTVYAQHYYGTKQKYITFGAKNTPENMIKAMSAALELRSDIESGKFDPLKIDKYKHSNKQLGTYNRVEDIGLIPLFDGFVNSLIIETTTRNCMYRSNSSHLRRMINQHGYTLKQQLEISAWVRTNVGQHNAIKLLAALYRMIEWGKRESKIPKDFPNKFKQYGQDFKKSLQGQRVKKTPPIAVAHLPVKEGIQAHSEENRDRIIAAFHSRYRQKRHRSQPDHIAYIIEFFFLTGCRHGEAFALVWKDIEYGKNKQGLPEVKINIDESYDSKDGITKNTKTRKHRKVPATPRVVEILEILKPEHPDPNLLVFRNTEGNHLRTGRLSKYWKPTLHDPDKGLVDYSIIGKMIRNGELDYYMELYSTRRTFTSLQINKGIPVTTVAKWIGDNPETVLKHYARPDDDAVPY
jgi:integrase